MSNKNNKTNKNKIAEEQLRKIQASKDKNLLKASSALITTALACLFAFVVLLILNLTKIVEMHLLIMFSPIFILIVAFILTMVVVARSMMRQGLLDPNAIKREEEKMMNNKMKNNKQFQQAKNQTNKNNKYSKYKNIK